MALNSMSDNELTRKDRERLQRRREILQAAQTLFSSKGFHSVSMQEVGEAAQFSIGSLYGFFESKEDLYRAVILDLVDSYFTRIDEAVEETEGEVEKLRTFLRVKNEQFHDKLDLLRLHFKETGGMSNALHDDIKRELRVRHGRHLERLGRVFAAGVERGVFAAVADPRFLAMALDSVSTAALLAKEDPPFPGVPGDADDVLAVLFEGLLIHRDPSRPNG